MQTIQIGQIVVYTDPDGNQYPAVISNPQDGSGTVDLIIWAPEALGYRIDQLNVPQTSQLQSMKQINVNQAIVNHSWNFLPTTS